MKPALLLAALLLAAPSARAADATFVLSHHGRLLDAADAPLDGEQELVFRLFASPVPLPSEQPVWQQAYRVAVSKGAYAVVLGDEARGKALTSAELDGTSPRYLSVAVGAAASELLPRARIGAVPFAVNAERLGGRVASEFLTAAKAASDYLAKADAGATYLTKEDAVAAYVTKSASAAFLEADDAAATYETLTGAASKYVEKSAAGAFLEKTAASTTYATKTELTPLATKADIANMAVKGDLTGLATKAEIGDMATKTEVAATYLKASDDAALDRRNLVRNGSFESWTGTFQNLASTPVVPIGWGANDGNQASVTRTRVTGGAPEGRAFLRFYNPGANGSQPETYTTFDQLPLEQDKTYTLAFWAKGSTANADKLEAFILATKANGTPIDTNWVQFHTGAVALTTDWKRFTYSFTTKADLALAANIQLRLDHNGNGTNVDLDGVGIWRGPRAPVYSEDRVPCPIDMVDAGDFCVEPTSALVRSSTLTWFDSNAACRTRGRRLCDADELGFALRSGLVQSASSGNVWIWTRQNIDGPATTATNQSFPCHITMQQQSGYLLGEVNCQIGPASPNPDIGRLCCFNR